MLPVCVAVPDWLKPPLPSGLSVQLPLRLVVTCPNADAVPSMPPIHVADIEPGSSTLMPLLSVSV